MISMSLIAKRSEKDLKLLVMCLRELVLEEFPHRLHDLGIPEGSGCHTLFQAADSPQRGLAELWLSVDWALAPLPLKALHPKALCPRESAKAPSARDLSPSFPRSPAPHLLSLVGCHSRYSRQRPAMVASPPQIAPPEHR